MRNVSHLSLPLFSQGITPLLESVGPNLGLQVGAATGWLAIVGFIAWFLHDRLHAEPEFVRKIVHIGTGNIVLIAWWLAIPGWIAIAASILFSGVALFSYYVPILPGIESVGRKSWGTFFYAASIGILVACFWSEQPQFTALGILVMTWGDGLAALVGRRWGTHKYQLLGNQKSWEGSAAMAIASFLISFLILLNTLSAAPLATIAGISLLTSLAATSLEMFATLGIDNLSVPLGGAAIAFWLSRGFL